MSFEFSLIGRAPLGLKSRMFLYTLISYPIRAASPLGEIGQKIFDNRKEKDYILSFSSGPLAQLGRAADF